MSRKIACPGYQQRLKWSTKYERRSRTKGGDLPGFGQLAFDASASVQGGAVTESRYRQDPETEVLATPPIPSCPLGDILGVNTELIPSRKFSVDSSYASLLPKTYSEAHNSESDPENRPYSGSAVEEVGDDSTSTISTSTPESKPQRRPSNPELPKPPNTVLTRTHPQLSLTIQTISSPSTFLIELWFKSVCSAWAAYDSPTNPFRRLGSSLWGSSRPLFYSLQSMAAASLPVRQPKIQEIASSAPRMATEAIIEELKTLFEEPNAVVTVPSGLIISLFCLSSSLCWMDHRQLGLQYLGHIRVILSLLDMRSRYLSKSDQNLLAFFKECLIYEESVRSIVTSHKEDIHTLLEWTPSPTPSDDFTLHPWTGVPPRIIGLFGKAMALCRKSRDLWRSSVAATYEVMLQAMVHINEAQCLEETLLSIRIPDLIHDSDDDRNGLDSHLHSAAEVFRLSSLLQLYQTFPDLVSRRFQDTGDAGGTTALLWPTSFALRITGLLSEIPQESIRCLQPLLCLSVGTGLRIRTLAPTTPQSSLLVTALPGSALSPLETWDICVKPSEQAFNDTLSARDFIMERLLGFGHGPAARPIVIIRQLLQAVWTCYDNEMVPGAIHWMDIMADLKYETVFG